MEVCGNPLCNVPHSLFGFIHPLGLLRKICAQAAEDWRHRCRYKQRLLQSTDMAAGVATVAAA